MLCFIVTDSRKSYTSTLHHNCNDCIQHIILLTVKDSTHLLIVKVERFFQIRQIRQIHSLGASVTLAYIVFFEYACSRTEVWVDWLLLGGDKIEFYAGNVPLYFFLHKFPRADRFYPAPRSASLMSQFFYFFLLLQN